MVLLNYDPIPLQLKSIVELSLIVLLNYDPIPLQMISIVEFPVKPTRRAYSRHSSGIIVISQQSSVSIHAGIYGGSPELGSEHAPR